MKGLLRIVSLFLPHFFAAVLSCRKSTDRRPVKFFLPYGMMRTRMRDVFGEEVGKADKDCGFRGFVRACLPYGLVLWWDGTPQPAGPAPVAKARPAPASSVSVVMATEIKDLRREMSEFREQMELLVLRALTQGGSSK